MTSYKCLERFRGISLLQTITHKYIYQATTKNKNNITILNKTVRNRDLFPRKLTHDIMYT